MKNFSLRISGRDDGITVDFDHAPQVQPLSILFDTSNDAESLVPAEPFEMQNALAAISSELGCSNTIDALRRQAPATLEWSDTLCNGERVNHAKAEKACTSLGEGWRLPTRMELESILDLTRHEPAIDTDRFPDTKSGSYWTSTPCAWSSGYAWIVHFSYGFADGYHRGGSLAFVRAVRSVPAGQ
jgi:hypothetical protein